MNRRQSTWTVISLAMLAAFAAGATAASWDESINGDLSGVPASPTPWTLDLGANPLIGSGGPDAADYDLVSFTIPTGMQLNSIGVNLFHNDFGLSFFGLQAGTPWLDGLGGGIVGDHLIGWVLVANEDEVADLLGAFQGVSPPITIPLPSGVYTLEMQDLDTTFQYSFSFNVTATATPIAGDFNGDGSVDGDDVAQWSGDFGLNGDSDADHDGDSDGADILVWQQNLNIPQIGVGPVPEPAAVTLAATFALAAASRRRRTRE